MSVRFLLVVGTMACAVVGWLADAQMDAAAAQAQAPRRSRAEARPALFTEAQAALGKTVYEKSCAACHGATLSGGSAPALAGEQFQNNWRNPAITLDDVFFVLRTTMPLGASDTLTPQEHVAVFAYILQVNGYPAGRRAMSANPTDLRLYPVQVAAAPLVAARPTPRAFIPSAGPAVAEGAGPNQAALGAAERSTDWLMHTHDYRGTRYSPLDEITAANASRLAPACMFQVGGGNVFQTGPVVHDGVMYVTSGLSTLALDATTCRVKWRHEWKLQDQTRSERNRGIAIKDGRIVRGTPDGYLLALNAQTGTLLWARQVAKPADGETFPMAPLVFEDLVFIAPAGSESNVQGWVGAFRLADGSPVWRFNTVPRPGEPGAETWDIKNDIPVGGGAIWTAFSLDAETGELHVPVTNPAPDLPVHLRGGSNLYTNSIVVLDARTGKLRWHRQLVPNDSHDWDLTHVAPIFETRINGSLRRLVATAGKDGVLRVLDRTSHEIVYETPVTTRENVETPVTTTPTRVCPGLLGGVEWNGPAFNSRTNLIYVPGVDWCSTFTAFDTVRHIPGKVYLGGRVTMDPVERGQGWVTAVDAATGQVKWKYRSSRPMVAGVTTTAGNLVLTGEQTGDFIALNAETGDVVYRFNTGGPVGGGVVTYGAGGHQYVAVASGSPTDFWLNPHPGAPTIVVFTLPRSAGSR